VMRVNSLQRDYLLVDCIQIRSSSAPYATNYPFEGAVNRIN